MKIVSLLLAAGMIIVLIASLTTTPLIDIAWGYILAIGITGAILFHGRTRNRCRTLINDLFGDNPE